MGGLARGNGSSKAFFRGMNSHCFDLAKEVIAGGGKGIGVTRAIVLGFN